MDTSKASVQRPREEDSKALGVIGHDEMQKKETSFLRTIENES